MNYEFKKCKVVVRAQVFPRRVLRVVCTKHNSTLVLLLHYLHFESELEHCYSRFSVKWRATYTENAHFVDTIGHLFDPPLIREFQISGNCIDFRHLSKNLRFRAFGACHLSEKRSHLARLRRVPLNRETLRSFKVADRPLNRSAT